MIVSRLGSFCALFVFAAAGAAWAQDEPPPDRPEPPDRPRMRRQAQPPKAEPA
ncbi:MAG: hypothetical protein HUU22_19310, partial [Phycisphaerae bacterium]|nr:hypothetical protein [Phycisphaerae bacterium]